MTAQNMAIIDLTFIVIYIILFIIWVIRQVKIIRSIKDLRKEMLNK